MSYKIGVILSMVFVALFFAFGVDLISIQFAFSNLDSKSVAISYRISNHGTLDELFIDDIEHEFNVLFDCLTNCNPSFGDIVEYQISTYIKPIVIAKGNYTITIKRTAVIGFYS